jgi:hypothetical protein
MALGFLAILSKLWENATAANAAVQLATRARDFHARHRKWSIRLIALISVGAVFGAGVWFDRHSFSKPSPAGQVAEPLTPPSGETKTSQATASKSAPAQTTPTTKADKPPVHLARKRVNQNEILPAAVNKLTVAYYKSHPEERSAPLSQGWVNYVNSGLLMEGIMFRVSLPNRTIPCIKHGIVVEGGGADISDIQSNACITEDVVHTTGDNPRIHGVVINPPKQP